MMSVFEPLAAWWVAIILPWAIESMTVAVLLVVILRLCRRSSPVLRKSIATLGLIKMALPPFALPVGLVSLGVTDPSGTSLAPLGAPLPLSIASLLATVHLVGVVFGFGLLIRRVRELRRLVAEAVPVEDEATRQAFF